MTEDLKQDIIDYWNRRPCGVTHSANQPGTREYFLDVTQRRRQTVDWLGSVSGFVDYARWSGKRVLEIGCGIGTEADEFARAGANYTGIDISAVSIELARKRFQVFDLPGQFFVMNGADPVGLADLGQFDLVYCNGVMHHWPDLVQFIINVKDILCQDGSFIFMVYSKHSWRHSMVQAGLMQYEAQDNCPYVKTYDHKEIAEFLQPHFHINDIIQEGCFMFNVEKYKLNQLELEPWFAAMSEEMRRAVDKFLGECFMVEAKLS
jgi:SAM-dependent methyltransferase